MRFSFGSKPPACVLPIIACSVGLASPLVNGIPFAQGMPQSKPIHVFASLPKMDSADTQPRINSIELSKQGDADAKKLAWPQALQEYQDALDLWTGNTGALYGLAACSQASGNMTKAIDYSRRAIYLDGSATKGFTETNTKRLMQYSLLLNHSGQSAEAIQVYNNAAYALDYQGSDEHDRKPFLKVLLPEVALVRTQNDQVAYTPEHLQALADAALAHEELAFGDNKEALAHMQEANKLYPDSAVTNYYLGEALPEQESAKKKVAYQQAIKLGSDSTIVAAKERLGIRP